MDDSSSNTAQTLASVLAGGLGGYIDSQNQQPVYVQQPAPQTAYGYAGTTQATPSSVGIAGIPMSALLITGAIVLAVFLLKK